MGTKPDDYYTIPLCFICHDLAHNDPKKFGERIGREEVFEAMLNYMIEWHIQQREMIQAANNYLAGGGCGGSSVQRAAELWKEMAIEFKANKTRCLRVPGKGGNNE